jgi:hypothetical protein
MKKVATTTGVLMIVFLVVDTKTREELTCKAFGKLAEKILRKASVKAGAVLEMSGQFNLYRGRLEFVLEDGAVCAVPDPRNASQNPVIPVLQSKSEEDIQHADSGQDGKSKTESIDSAAQDESIESELESSPASLFQCCPNCSPDETRVDCDKPSASAIE